jgi:hypothetical protein
LATTTAIIEEEEKKNNNNFDRKLDLVTAGLQPFFIKILQQKLPHTHSQVIVDYLFAMKTEKNLSLHYTRTIIKLFFQLARFTNFKAWKTITREDILAFLDSYRRPDASDPMHKWVGTYNFYRIIIMAFFKWVYSPDIESGRRPKPSCIENIPKLKRGETSCYKATDLWGPQDDLLFLKYCPSARDRCYHAISRDLSARPAEILNLRIRDIHYKMIGTSAYAEVVVNGKTGQRNLPIINALPFLKDWVDYGHPQRGNNNAFLIPTFHRKYFGRKMTVAGLYDIYCNHYKRNYFPKLLSDPSVPPEDKAQIRELLLKPWNPYVRRHSSLTEKSKILKEYTLRQHAGWKPKSDMPEKYLHYFGSESSDSLLEAYGLVNPDERADIYTLKPKQCPNCSEPNKVDSKFCAKCRMILTYDAYNETVTMNQKYEQEMEQMRQSILITDIQ